MNRKNKNSLNNIGNQVVYERVGDALQIKLHGDFVRYNDLPQLDAGILASVKKVLFVDDGINGWDSSLVLVVYDILKPTIANGVAYDASALPQNLQELIKLAFAVDRKPSHGGEEQDSFLERIGENTVKFMRKIRSVVDFLGNVCLSAFWSDLF